MSRKKTLNDLKELSDIYTRAEYDYQQCLQNVLPVDSEVYVRHNSNVFRARVMCYVADCDQVRVMPFDPAVVKICSRSFGWDWNRGLAVSVQKLYSAADQIPTVVVDASTRKVPS